MTDEDGVLTEEDILRAREWLNRPLTLSNDHVCFAETEEQCPYSEGHYRPITLREVGKPLVTEDED